MTDDVLAAAIARSIDPLTGGPHDLDCLVNLVAEKPIVLIGEASHGTTEFYHLRAELTRRLIVAHGFHAVAVEADWPDAYRVNRFVRGLGGDRSARAALVGFERFPTWMWRNTEVLAFVEWLRAYDDASPRAPVGFYGLDLYCLHASVAAVLQYLDEVDGDAAARARDRYRCLEGVEPQRYGYAASLGLRPDCEQEAVGQLRELQSQRAEVLGRDMAEGDDHFEAEENARVVRDAEAYYRTMFGGRVSSWNLRDTHMADTLDALIDHLRRRHGRARVIVWAHNSHVGDARATQMGAIGEHTLGQLVRERHPGDVRLIGFSTYTGTVSAASDWDEPVERKIVRPALPESYEALFHRVRVPRFVLPLGDLGLLGDALREPRLQRAIGVVYHPHTERQSHYLEACLPAQFDALVHIDETSALTPLGPETMSDETEAPETFPSGL
jgi:erythromycin esterase-like protein